jgi:hypothetical protein
MPIRLLSQRAETDNTREQQRYGNTRTRSTLQRWNPQNRQQRYPT